MKTWLAVIAIILALMGGFAWWALLDGAAPAHARGVFDIAQYRALVASDAPETLPTEVRAEFVGESEAPSLAAMAGDFGPARTFTYASFQIVAPGGDTIIDGAVDAETLNAMSAEGRFEEASYQRVLAAMTQAGQVLITHEHLDHVMAIARHPDPDAVAPRLRLTRPQLDALPQHAPGGALAPAIAAASPLDLNSPTRIAPGIVAAPAPGHSPGTIVIYVRAAAREYLFIGDIAWVMDSVREARGRPRFIRWIVSGVDPDRNAVLRQLRALHDIAAAEPELVIVPAHDAPYLRELVGSGALTEGFAPKPPPPA